MVEQFAVQLMNKNRTQRLTFRDNTTQKKLIVVAQAKFRTEFEKVSTSTMNNTIVSERINPQHLTLAWLKTEGL